MSILIVESCPNLGQLWKRHLTRFGATVALVHDQDAAIAFLHDNAVDVIVLNLVLKGGGAIALADVASVLQPDARIVFVTNTSFFSDGSIFQLCANACAFVQSDTSPEDLAAIVEHHASIKQREATRGHGAHHSPAQG